jgi:Ca2+-binding RTX toxin-like protein
MGSAMDSLSAGQVVTETFAVASADGTSKPAAVTVTITGTNDAPTIVSGPAYSIQENLTAVGTVLATDPDAGTTLKYSIVGGPDAAKLQIDANSGLLSFKSAPDYEAPGDVGADNVYNVRVQVSDGSLSATQDIAVTVTNQPGIVLNGTAAAETLTGTGEEDTLYGLGGNDTLMGLAGNDVLDGGAGNDSMVGGLGNDTYYVDSTGDVVVENIGEGRDEVRTTLTSYTLGANVEDLTFIGTGNFTGTGNADKNYIKGGAGSDNLSGGAGDDTLDGGAGGDLMSGGAGNDTYYVDNVGDTINELSQIGIDTVLTTLGSYTLGANVENLTYLGTGNFSGTGNTSANVITGGIGNDVLSGGAGNDTLIGGAGNDTMDGGTGSDVFVFAAGFGQDRINNFGATPASQDRLDISALGITLATFGSAVQMELVGADTLVHIGALDTILLAGINPVDVTSADFILAP